MRQQYIFDGAYGGTLCVTESPKGGHVALCFALEGQVVGLELSEAEFRELAELRYRLQFDRPEVAQLRAV
jgi:hypothetical protein